MEAWIFALYMTVNFNMPVPFGLAIHDYASQLEWVEPHHVAAVVIAEHAADGDFPTDSVSSAGAIGLGQVMPSVRREYNRKSGDPVRIKAADLYDWRTNLKVLSWEINRVQRVHATKARCRGKVHHWHAHYLCDFDVRETCNTRWRQKLTKKTEAWKAWTLDVDASLSGLLCMLSEGSCIDPES